MIFSKLQAFGFRRTFEKMGIHPARKVVFMKAGLRVWSEWAFFGRERWFSLRQGLGFEAKIMIFKAPGHWFQKDF